MVPKIYRDLSALENPLVEASISSNRLNPAWDRFPTPLSVIRLDSS